MSAVLAMLVVVVLNIVANGFLKQGALEAQAGSSWFNSMIAIGALAFGAAFLAYVFVLRTLPLHMAQALAALQFVGAIVISRWFFLEKIGLVQWIGISLIIAGIILLGFAYDHQSTSDLG
jgi:drug/metabolite transporter (DMT)-like permease